jgi:hypothetical protein
VSKTLRKAMIARNAKFVDTEPERMFDAYQKSRAMGLVQNVVLPFTDEALHYEFQLDFARPFDGTYDIAFLIDGPYHQTARIGRKDAWKDRVMNRQGLKVVHIPSELTSKKWWGYLDGEIAKALLSPVGSTCVPD